MNTSSVVTRFAPSPTGFLHIGGARTALFNWLYAKKTGGKMLLRIEDTDRERSTEPAIAAILDGLTWLQLDWDGDIIYQFSRAARHHDMGVTHVIRGDDHLINAARQKQIYDALGWDIPNMSHIPLIHGPDGAKLSKRHGALGVEAYRAMGYLPAALRNYLVRLGWSHGDQEIFSTHEMIDAFDLSGIGRSAARFDFAKLENLNGHYIRQSDDNILVKMFEDVLVHVPDGAALKAKLNDRTRAQLLQAMPSLKERAKTLIELIAGSYFIFADRPLEVEPN